MDFSNSGNDKYLTESIIEILSNKERAKRFGVKARNTVNRKFSSKTMIEKTEKVYMELLHRA